VKEGLPASVAVNPTVDPLVKGLVHLPVEVRRDERAVLGAEICTTDKDGFYLVAHCLVVKFKVFQDLFGLEVEDALDIFRVE